MQQWFGGRSNPKRAGEARVVARRRQNESSSGTRSGTRSGLAFRPVIDTPDESDFEDPSGNSYVDPSEDTVMNYPR
jgi:hypothetical protein